MLIRASRCAGITKESFVGNLAWKGLKGIKGIGKRMAGDVGALGKGLQAQKGIKGGGVERALTSWKPKTLVGKTSRVVARNPLKTMGAVGGTYMAGSAVAGGVRSAVANNSDPHALQRRRMQGFRSQS